MQGRMCQVRPELRLWKQVALVSLPRTAGAPNASFWSFHLVLFQHNTVYCKDATVPELVTDEPFPTEDFHKQASDWQVCDKIIPI